MTERLTFGYGTNGHGGEAPARPVVLDPQPAVTVSQSPPESTRRPKREAIDWAFVGLLGFTVALFMRPQDQIPGLSAVPFAQIFAILGVATMLYGRVSRGLSISRVTPELMGVGALGFVMLLTAPFSIWPGGSVGAFTDVFGKVVLIYVLMVNTLTTPERIHKFMALIVLASGYLSTRAMFDYARGLNLIENGRVQGAIGGMFRNPNDMALNMVAVLPLCALVAIRAKTTARRIGVAFLGVMIVGAITASHSRGGFIGLAAMVIILGVQLARRRPAVVGAGALVLLLAVPFTPGSYWERILSITDNSLDATGSREARKILLTEAWETFLAHPLFGIGAAQFPNYNPPGRVETWRETHNVLLQVAAELGVLGIAVFLFLLWRSLTAARRTRQLLRRAAPAPPRRWQLEAGHKPKPAVISSAEADYLDAHAGALNAAIIGWFVCALFASVAYSWTFYYLLALAAAPQVMLSDRLATSTRRQPEPRLVEVRA